MPSTPIRRFSDTQRSTIIQWGVGLPFGLRTGTFVSDFVEGDQFTADGRFAEDDGSEIACILDRRGNSIYDLTIPDGAAPGTVALTYPDDNAELFASIEDALAMVTECERDYLATPLPEPARDAAVFEARERAMLGDALYERLQTPV